MWQTVSNTRDCLSTYNIIGFIVTYEAVSSADIEIVDYIQLMMQALMIMISGYLICKNCTEIT